MRTPHEMHVRVDVMAAGRSRPLIVVVQSDPATSAQLARHLRAAGYAAVTVPSTDAALRVIATTGARGVIADINEHTLDGRGLVDAVRSLPGGRDIPVMVQSDSGHVEEFHRIMRAGRVWYIGRGATWPHLERTLSTMLSRAAVTPLTL